jgi:hypothetical protein
MKETKQPEKPGFLSNIRVMANALSTIRSMRGLRDLFNVGGQKRDIEAECGHPVYIDPADYWKKFDRGDVAYRAVSIYPDECFKDRPLIYETDDAEETTDFERELDAVEDEVHLLSIIQRADILSGVGRFGVILLGLSDGLGFDKPVAGFENGMPDFPEPSKAPAPNAQGAEGADPAKQLTQPSPLRLLYLRTFDESMVVIKDLERDPKNARFGQPKMYTITFMDDAENPNSGQVKVITPPPPPSGIQTTPGQMTSTKTTLDVHWSRVIHLVDNRLRDEIFGTPRLKKIFDRILDLHKIAGSAAEMFWKNAKGGLALEQIPSTMGEPVTIDKEGMKDEMEQFYEGLKPYLALEGMTAKQLSPAVADPGPNGEFQIRLIAMAIGCPMRVFMGSEQAQLASGQDTKQWNERLQKRREEYLTPFVLRPVIDRLILMKVLPFPKGDQQNAPKALPGRPQRPSYTIFWNDLNTPTQTERAQFATQLTDALSKYVAGGLDQIIDPPHFLELVAGFSKEETDSILKEVGDRMVETDPAAEADQAQVDAQAAHQRDLEKIKAAGEAKALAAVQKNQEENDRRFARHNGQLPPINLNLEVKMPEKGPVKKSFKIEKQNGEFRGTVEETQTP